MISRSGAIGGIGGTRQNGQAKATLKWQDFKTAKYENNENDRHEVEQRCMQYIREKIELNNYMIEEPQICHSTDRLRKVCDLFRHMQLRQIMVINPTNGQLVGIITRQDIFAYMSI